MAHEVVDLTRSPPAVRREVEVIDLTDNDQNPSIRPGSANRTTGVSFDTFTNRLEDLDLSEGFQPEHFARLRDLWDCGDLANLSAKGRLGNDSLKDAFGPLFPAWRSRKILECLRVLTRDDAGTAPRTSSARSELSRTTGLTTATSRIPDGGHMGYAGQNDGHEPSRRQNAQQSSWSDRRNKGKHEANEIAPGSAGRFKFMPNLTTMQSNGKVTSSSSQGHKARFASQSHQAGASIEQPDDKLNGKPIGVNTVRHGADADEEPSRLDVPDRHTPSNRGYVEMPDRDSRGRSANGLADMNTLASSAHTKRNGKRSDESQLLRENLMHGTFGPSVLAWEISSNSGSPDALELRSAGRSRTTSSKQQVDGLRAHKESTSTPGSRYGHDNVLLQRGENEIATLERPSFKEPSARRSISAADAIPRTLNAVEEVLDSHLKELAEDHEHWTRSYLVAARRMSDALLGGYLREESSNASSTASNVVDAASPFTDITPIETVIASTTATAQNTQLMSQIVQPLAKGMKSSSRAKSTIRVPVSKYRASADPMPFYTHYVSAAANFRAENCDKLLYWPYFYDDQESDPDLEELHDHLSTEYRNLTEKRARYVELIHKSTKWRPYVEAFLEELRCGYKDVLRYLLCPSAEPPPDLGLDPEDLEIWKDRGERRREDFDPDHPRWKAVLKNLAPSSGAELAFAGLACHAFLKLAKFSIWHVARRSQVALDARRGSEAEDAKDPITEIRSALCRICHRLNCPYHGINDEEDLMDGTDSDDAEEPNAAESLLESPDPDPDDKSSSTGGYYSSDEDGINDEKAVLAPKHRHEAVSHATRIAHGHHAFDHQRWAEKGVTNMMHERKPFWPCDHAGSCESKKCSCWRQGINCEKACGCSSSCRRRFPGCRCSQKGKPCASSHKCPCNMLNRECDPDLCGTCGARDILDPLNRYNDALLHARCRNVFVQRDRPKHTKIGVSQVAGCGLYACEDIPQGDFISEYKGEICGHKEGERRGVIYGFRPNNYLFTISDVYDVDSMHYGNKTRFINNSEDRENINVEGRLLMCNMVVRIGMFAKRDIKAGEELFFCYGYEKEITSTFWEVGEAPKDKTQNRVGAASSKRKSKAKAQLSTINTPAPPAMILDKTPLPPKSRRKDKLNALPQDDEQDIDYRPDSQIRRHVTAERPVMIRSSSESEDDLATPNGRQRLPRSVHNTPRGRLNRAEDWDRILAEHSESEEYRESTDAGEDADSEPELVVVPSEEETPVRKRGKRKRTG